MRNINNIIINGNSYSASGKNISVINNKIIIDGQVIEEGLSGIVEISFTGDLASLKTNGSVTVNGNVIGSVDAGGSVNCGRVGGDVDAGGSVKYIR